MNVQSIVLRRTNKLYLSSPTTSKLLDLKYPTPSTAAPSLSLVATFNLNLQALGYTLSSKALNILVWLSEPTAQKLFDDTLAVLKEVKGVRNYKPMYPNFPKQVIEASAAELYINAIIHYWSFVLVDLTGDPDKIWLPKYAKDKREPLDEKVELRVIGVATEKDVALLTTRIATSNTSISASDKEDLKVLVQGGNGDLLEIFPAIKNKENLAYLGALIFGAIDIAPYFKTATDVLRLATALSNGDVSLKDDSKFRKFNRSERKYLLGLLEKISNKEEDMLRWRERWVHLGKMLRPGEYAKRFPTTFRAFDALRNHRKIETMRSRIEDVVRNGSAMDAARLLMERPGDFARRLDHVLRQAPRQTMTRVVNAFWIVAEQVSTPVLLQTLAHFEHRQESGLRVVFPKGNVANVTALDKPLPVLPEAVTELVVQAIKATLVERFSVLPKLGKVYIDPALKDCLVPFSQRSASKSLRTLVRGSKLPFGDEKDTLRFFIWWHDAVKGVSREDWYDSNRVDLDLSAVLYDENWTHTGEITFYDLRHRGRNGYYAVHSGDITSAPNGASEFIDINIPEAVADGVRYVIMSVHGYTPQNFCDLPECFAGFMLREHAQSGEVYDPRTITDKVDLAMAAQDGIPLIIDLVDRKVIWCDAAMKSHQYRYHTVASNRGTIELLGRAFTSIHKPTLYDLFSLHAAARGKLVTDEAKADVVFSVKAGTPFELDRIASEFMTDAVKKPAKKSKAASV